MKKINERTILVAVTGALCACLIDSVLRYTRREDQVTAILVGIGNALQLAGVKSGTNQGSQGQPATQETGSEFTVKTDIPFGGGDPADRPAAPEG